MKAKDSRRGRKKRGPVRLTVEYIPASESRADFAIRMLAYLLGQSIAQDRRERRDGGVEGVPVPQEGGARDLEGNTPNGKNPGTISVPGS